MGCGNSTSKTVGGTPLPESADGGDGKQGKGGENQQLLATYTLGEVLGQGAFGVVYACAVKPTRDFKYAVKMVDKVETPVAEIKKEAEMMLELSHPNVVKFHAVYYEKCFVCIVMDKYGGGDLIEGMQYHWKTKGRIPPYSVLHIVRGMAAAVAHLHGKLYVHRDVKGDNFLTSKKEITESDCVVIMSDFGTVQKLSKKTDRLKACCGTKIYWPPEFYNGNYALKVDIWALGVILYGLCDGRFPFKGEQDTKNKQVRLPNHIPAACQELVMQLLEKDEAKRLDYVGLMAHRWIVDQSVKIEDTPAPSADEKPMGSIELQREGGANGAQHDRRMELVDRLDGRTAKNTTLLHTLWCARFDVKDKRTGKSLRYEWWNQEKVASSGVIELDNAISASAEVGKVDVATVGQMLKEHNIDTSKFGKETYKTLEQFAAEVHSGAAMLMLDAAEHKKLVRVVDVVLLRITYGNMFLTEIEERFVDGRERKALNRLPGTKKESHENTKRTTERILKDFLNLNTSLVKFMFDQKEVFEHEEESISYPNVRTVYRREIIEGELVVKDEATLKQFGLSDSLKFNHANTKGDVKVFKWMTEQECKNLDIKLRQDGGDEISGLVQAPIGYSQEELTVFLKSNGVDPKDFGKDNSKTLKEFSNELIKGEASLMVNSNNQLIRVVEIVVLYINKQGTTDILVEFEEHLADGTKRKTTRLPGAKRRPDENQFVTAQRVLKRQLKMDENCVNLNAVDVKIAEEQKKSPSYANMITLYRKRIISAELLAL